ncbi:MAG: stage II sporulation protein M [Candidatus Nanoarchaeia archaeon]|nr:stage II sporulation protein M [Candidatus Nanoarchaeia archaeon]
MVLESLINAENAESHPFKMFLLGILFSSVGILLSLWIFKDQSSLVAVFLTVFACIPLIYHTIRLEEKKEVEIDSEKKLLKEHSRAITYFVMLFLGFVVSFFVWYLFLPQNLIETLFNTQHATINAINAQVSSISGNAISSKFFLQIFTNNLKVLLFCVFFAFFYGAGAVFILTWNASVIGTAIGSFIRNNLSEYASHIGLAKVAGYFHVVSFGILKYMTHGIFEIVAYFVGGLAGGIISVAVIRRDINGERFKRIMYDSLDLVLIALVILILGAIIEVYVTPRLF